MTDNNPFNGQYFEFGTVGQDTPVSINGKTGQTIYINGVQDTNSLTNTRALSGYNILTPAATTLVANTWTRLEGTTTVDTHSYKFTHTANRLTYTGAVSGIVVVAYAISITGNVGDVITFGTSLNGASPDISSQAIVTIPTGGGVANVCNTAHVSMATTDYVEIWVKNTIANPVTAVYLTVSTLGMF